jgi:hypothetical protein
MRRMTWWGLAAAILLVSACSGNDSSPSMTGSPTSPSSPTSPTTPTSGNTAGAIINGMIAPSSSASTSEARTGEARTSDVSGVATVQVVGTNVSSAIDGFGRFSLKDVPAGTGSAQLRFTGSRADATAGVNGLVSGQAVTIVVTVSGSQAVVVSDSRSPNAEIPINGNINGLTGSAAAFEFTIEGRLIRGDASTQFFGDGNRADSFTNLINGGRVETKTQARDGFFYAVRIHINNTTSTPPPGTPVPPQPQPTPPQEESASIEGPLTALSGGSPNLVLAVNGTTVRTSASTDVQRRGDKQDLSTLRLGQTLHVIGVRRSDGSIDARLIQIKDDAPSGEFSIDGSMGGLKGSCPNLTFKVNGYSIASNGSTAFPNAACGSFKNGDKVRVRGIRQVDESVNATSIEKQ